MELKLTIHPTQATRFGLKLRCSPGGQEETVVTYDTRRQHFIVDFDRASLDPNLVYGGNPRDTTSATRRQVVPFALQPNQPLHVDCFIDRSVIEIFVNSRICITQRVYPHPPRQPRIQDLHRGPPNHRPEPSSNGKWTPPTPGDPQLP